MTLRIRIATFRERTAIIKNNISLAFETENRKLDPAVAEAGVDTILNDPSKGFYVIGEYARRIIGQCMVTFEWSDWRSGSFWWIQSVYVDEGCRQKGVFSQIYAFVEQQAIQRSDCVGIRLYVDKTNQIAQEVYRSLGLQETRYKIFEREFTIHSQ